jgi:prepilin peptidase CpaA
MHWIAWWPTVAVLAVASFTDLRSRKIPNWLVGPFLLAGIVFSAISHGWSGLGHSLAGIAAGAAIFAIPFALGGMGMGDLKLFAAVGAWIWASQLFFAFILTAIAGGLMAIGWAVFGGFMGELMEGSGDLLFGFAKRGLHRHPDLVLQNPKARKMPYAPAIAVGTIISFFAR